MKVQREDRVLGKNFDYRYRLPNVYLADFPVLSDVSCDDAALRESGFWNGVPMPNGFCHKEIPHRYHDSLRKPMKLRRYVVPALMTASAALGLIAAPAAVADPVTPNACAKEWLAPRPRTICEDNRTSEPVGPDTPGGPGAPAGPGPGPSGPGGPR